MDQIMYVHLNLFVSLDKITCPSSSYCIGEICFLCFLFLGIRHFAMLKLTGNGEKASGTVELLPLNGK